MITWSQALQPCNYSPRVPVYAVTFMAIKCCYFLLPGPGRDSSLPSMRSSLFCQQRVLHCMPAVLGSGVAGDPSPALLWHWAGSWPHSPGRSRGQQGAELSLGEQLALHSSSWHLPGNMERPHGQRGQPRAGLTPARPSVAESRAGARWGQRGRGAGLAWQCPAGLGLAPRPPWPGLPAPARGPTAAVPHIHYAVMGECSKGGSERKEYITGNYL